MTFVVIPYIGKPNGNGRIYTKEAIEKMVEDFNSKKHPMLGRLGYPDTQNEGNDVNLKTVSHEITKLYIKDDQLWADIKILDTENGRTLEECLEQKFIEFRPLCIGSVNEDKTVQVEKFITVDAIDKATDAFNV